MNPNLEHAIVEFLANEFHTQPENIIPDTDFSIDFSLTREQILDLITRMQDALDFILPEEKAENITTVGDLFAALQPETSTNEPV